MKTCPKCQQQYPNGFQYCPNDTELLMTTEEYVRRTAPLASEPVNRTTENTAESSEVVPIAVPPVQRVTEPVKPVAPEPEKTPTTPPRQTEPIRTAPPQAAKESYQEELKKAASSAAKSTATPQPPATASKAASKSASSAEPSAAMTTPGGFSLAIPQQPGLLENLFASLKNIRQILSKGDYKPGEGSSFLLPEESFKTRVTRELGTAALEFKQNPQQFVTELARGEGTNLRRRNSLLAGSLLALVGYTTVFFLALLLMAVTTKNPFWVNASLVGGAVYLTGCFALGVFLLRKMLKQVTTALVGLFLALVLASWGPVSGLFVVVGLAKNYGLYCLFFPKKCVPPEELKEEEVMDVAMVDTNKLDLKLKESAKAKEKMLGGSKAQPKQASGGGGGGRNEPTPPSQGRPPQMALTPQIIPPNPEPPKIKNPTLVVASTIYGDPKVMPPMKGPIGDPEGVPAPPSSGPGQGAGIGRGTGTGVGRGGGGGLGPGQGGNTGGGNMGLGGGGSIEPQTASLKPTIIYKERARYTEEARVNKIQGTVVLSLVYTFDGRITDIRVVRGLPDGLSESAIEAAKKIRFQPAVKNGQPVSVRGQIEFGFTLY